MAAGPKVLGGTMAKIARCLLCTCEGSMEVDPGTASQALGGVEVRQVSHLCTRDLDRAADALEAVAERDLRLERGPRLP